MGTETRNKGGRPKGIPKTGGRQKGTPNKTTAEVRELALGLLSRPRYVADLANRLDSGTVSPAVEQMLWHYAHGKPKDTVELTGENGLPLAFTLKLNGNDGDV